ncbi:MAG TPA: phosphonate C-P lyase system protein PhnH [Pseudolabrys sp.]|uniref:phosphonate C-P lyase system protein PhnH n=1 Tax=Pseudolabrys sp. TaxID=1960880 RepID=UPI002DDCEA4B|nr:phosphonate C-P lyase system protein PhnH [Pseudolabrys sp.]HEV2631044.1 phosphonate C-P lyase system protein PhnH [Pseudolabrys sp.]
MSELVFQTQDTFRALMDATARPGTIRMLQGAHAPPPLMPVTAAVISSLADYETPLWLDAGFSDAPAVLDWIRFTAGARIVEDPREAAFALISSARVLPDFGVFAQGSEEYPDCSTTLIVQLPQFKGEVISLCGPGIRDTGSLAVASLPDDFTARWANNRALFPRGVDVILVAGTDIAALPRTVHITRSA